MAWHSEIFDEKPHKGARQLRHSKGEVLSVSSSRDRVDELWSMLRYDVLLDDATKHKLKSKGVKNKAQLAHVMSELSSYIDQAENFYTSASSSDYRSAPLLYYYSFLNLAKTYIVLQRPELVNNKFTHGIKRRKSTGSLADRSFVVEQSSGKRVSVFGELYSLTYGKELANNRAIAFRHTLGYMTDITTEANKLLNRFSTKAHPAKLYVFLNHDTKKCWTVLTTRFGFYPANYKTAFNKFAVSFQRFDPGPITRDFTFKMTVTEAKQNNFSQSIEEYDFLESGIVPDWETRKHIEDALGEYCQDHAYDDEASFLITDPLKKSWQVPFGEVFAIYSMMFCLSEIVRYSPGEFSTNFAPNTKAGWLIKSFIGSTPYTCLVHLVSLITGKTYVIKGR